MQLGKGSGLWSTQWGRPGQGPGQERTWGSPKAEEVLPTDAEVPTSLRVDRGWSRRGERGAGETAGSRGSRLGLRIPRMWTFSR